MIKKITILNVLIILFLNSCNFSTISETEDMTLYLSLKTNTDRTITTAFDNEISYYNIVGYDSTELNSIDQVITTTDSEIIGIFTEDLWSFTVEAFDESDNLIAYGENTLQISDTEQNILAITLNYTQDSTGNLLINATWPTTANIDSIEVYWNGTNTNTETVTGSTFNYSELDLPSGTGIGSLKFYYLNTLVYTITESVHIYDNQTSSEIYNITTTELSVPDKPTGLTVESLDPYTMYLEWDKGNADMYLIYRSTSETFNESYIYRMVTFNNDYPSFVEFEESGDISFNEAYSTEYSQNETDESLAIFYSEYYDTYFEQFLIACSDYGYGEYYNEFYYYYFYYYSYDYNNPDDYDSVSYLELFTDYYVEHESGTTYYYWIKAVNGIYSSEVSDVASAVITDLS